MSLKKLFDTFKDDTKPVTNAVDRYLLSLNHKKDERRKYCFHPSSIGKCPRKMQYEFLDYPKIKTHKPQTQFIFAMGHALQEVYFQFMLKSGLGFTRRDIERPMHNYKMHIHGHADAYSPKLAWGIDIKTTKDPVSMWIDGERVEIPFAELKAPHPEYIWQMQAYMMCDANAKFWQIVYLNKNTQEVKEFRVERDEKMIAEIYAMLRGILEANKRRELVDRPEEYLPNKPPCAWCEYRSTCWDDFAKPNFKVQDEIEAKIIDLRTGKRKIQDAEKP